MFEGLISIVVSPAGIAVALIVTALLFLDDMTDERASASVAGTLRAQREELDERYREGRMTFEEHERRIGLLEEPGTRKIMHHATDVDGVGPQTALEIARHFEGDFDAYRDADVPELQRVNGVGPNRAQALLNR